MTVSQTPAVGQTRTDPSLAASSPQRKLDLGEDAFLQLLITQLRYQDPLSPMEDAEFIAQLAQFTALGELQKLNESLVKASAAQSLAYAASLIGRSIEGLADDGSSVSGIVEKVSADNGRIYVHAGGQKLALDSIRTVSGGTDGTTS